MRTGEESRLQALHSFRLLDTPSEPQLDEVARLAARGCQTPIAMVSLVDRERQFFKASVGTSLTQTPRPGSFCSHAIASGGLFVVEDALSDPRFAGHPMVAGGPHVRFYAGAPLVAAGGAAIGTLCALDTRPRTLTPAQGELLEVLAKSLVLQLELRRTNLLRGLLAEALSDPLRDELSGARLAAARLLPKPGAVSALLHTERADDLASVLSVLAAPELLLSRTRLDLAPLLVDLSLAFEPQVRVAVSGDCRGSWDADRLSEALARLCEEGLQPGPLELSVAGRDDEVVVELRFARHGSGDPAGWADEAGTPLERAGRLFAQRVMAAHGGAIEASPAGLRVRLPRS